MKTRTLLTSIAAFVVSLVVVIGLVGGAGLVMSAGGPSSQPTDVTPPSFDTDQTAQPIESAGSITVENASAKRIVVDGSHGNAISRSSFEPFLDALTGAGHTVTFVGGSSTSIGLSGQSGPTAFEESLTEADALVIANPAMTYTAEEIETIQTFADAGGRVLLLADTPTQASSATAILGISTGTTSTGSGQPDDVAARFGMTFDSAYLFNMEQNANNFQMTYGTASSDSSLTEGADTTVFEAAVPITSDTDPTTVVTIDGHLSSTREAGTFPVVTQTGNVTAVGDTWVFSPEGATVEDNEALVGNVASFLVTGEKKAGVPSFESSPTGGIGSPPPSSPSGPTMPTTPPSNQTNSST